MWSSSIEYYDPESGKGVVYVFQPSDDAEKGPIRLKGLERDRTYRVNLEDAAQGPSLMLGAELMDKGLSVELEGDGVSELVFFELVR